MPPQPPTYDVMDPRMSFWSARNPPSPPTAPFTGRTILITGANIGLGFEAALKFASLDAARLVLGVRSLDRGDQAKREICERTGYDVEKVLVMELDMARFQSVRVFADQVTKEVEMVDVVVLNAGVASPSYVLSSEGWEMGLQVNVLSTALLGILLLPVLKKSAVMKGQPATMEFVGSAGHQWVKPEMFDLQQGSKGVLEQVNQITFFDPKKTYCVTKLFVMYIMDGLLQEMAKSKTQTQSQGEGESGATKTENGERTKMEKSEHAEGEGEVVILTTCTGLCRTNLGRDFGIVAKVFNTLWQSVFARSAEQGSRSIVSAAALGREAHGKFWSHDVFFGKGEMVTSEVGKEVQKRVWSEIKEILGKEVADLDAYFRP